MSRSRTFWIIFFIIVIAVAIRSYDITARNIWFDEAFSWRLMQYPIVEMIERSALDVHPPLYYIFLKIWSVVFGSSLMALRTFSVVMAGLTVLAGYLFASYAWRSRVVGLTAAAFLALSAWQISFAWEARMYTLGAFFAIISSWFLLRAIRESGDKAVSWIFYVVAAVAFAYVHYFAFFTIAAHALFVAGYIIVNTKGRIGEILHMSTTWYASGSVILATLLYFPWISVFWDQFRRVQDDWWTDPVGWWTVPDTFYRMFAPTTGIPAHTGWMAALTLTPIVLTFIGWVILMLSCLPAKFTAGKKNGICDANYLVVLCGFIPFLFSIIFSFTGQSIYQDRFLVFAHLFILFGLAALIWKIRVRHISSVIITMIIFLFSWTFVQYWQELSFAQRPGAKEAARFIFDNNPSAPILISSPFVYFSIEYYVKEELNSSVDPKLYSESSEVLHFTGGPVLKENDIAGRDWLDNFEPGDYLWVIDATVFGGHEMELPGNWHRDLSLDFKELIIFQGDVIVNGYIKQ